jgi:hypothetical protein
MLDGQRMPVRRRELDRHVQKTFAARKSTQNSSETSSTVDFGFLAPPQLAIDLNQWRRWSEWNELRLILIVMSQQSAEPFFALYRSILPVRPTTPFSTRSTPGAE